MPISREVAEYREINNLCPRCGEPKESDKSMCRKHLDQFATKAKRLRKKKINLGKCPSCGKDKNSNKYYCDICKDKFKERRKIYGPKQYMKRIKNCLCTSCSDKLSDQEICNNLKRCQRCRQKQAQNQKLLRENKIKNNLCVICGANSANSKKYCQKCSIKRSKWYKQSPTRKKDKIKRMERQKIVVHHYGNQCSCCGEEQILFLQLDHIDGDGNKHRKRINKYGSTFFKWIIDNNFPNNFKLLCANCNTGRYRNGGICPHQDKQNEEKRV